MDERLKKIWSGFQATTTRNLTGGGVDNIDVPHRRDYSVEDTQLLPEEFEAPAQAAFAALRTELESKAKRFGRSKKKPEASYAGMRDKPDAMASRRFDGEELIKGLKATAMRTERPERDYGAFLASAEGKAAFKKFKRKKRFGIF